MRTVTKTVTFAALALVLLFFALFPGTLLEPVDSVRHAWLRHQHEARFTACLRTHNMPTGPEKPHTAYERRQRDLCHEWALDDTYGRREHQ